MGGEALLTIIHTLTKINCGFLLLQAEVVEVVTEEEMEEVLLRFNLEREEEDILVEAIIIPVFSLIHIQAQEEVAQGIRVLVAVALILGGVLLSVPILVLVRIQRHMGGEAEAEQRDQEEMGHAELRREKGEMEELDFQDLAISVEVGEEREVMIVLARLPPCGEGLAEVPMEVVFIYLHIQRLP